MVSLVVFLHSWDGRLGHVINTNGLSYETQISFPKKQSVVGVIEVLTLIEVIRFN